MRRHNYSEVWAAEIPDAVLAPANSDFTQHGKPPVENGRGEVA